jgi:NADH-quinone oxidoreductase subunit E
MNEHVQVEVDLSGAQEIIDKYRGKKGVIVPLLQDLQKHYRYVPGPTIDLIAEELGIPPASTYGLLTFYSQFHLEPRGKHEVSICIGTACHVKGAVMVQNALERKLGISSGETSPDMEFSLDAVRCLGCCALAPVAVLDTKYHGLLTPSKVDDMLGHFELGGQKDEE